MCLVRTDGRYHGAKVITRSPMNPEQAERVLGKGLTERQMEILNSDEIHEYESEKQEDIQCIINYIEKANRFFAKIFGFPSFSGHTTIRRVLRVVSPLYFSDIIPEYDFDDVVVKVMESGIEETAEAAEDFVNHILSETVYGNGDAGRFEIPGIFGPLYGTFRKIENNGRTLYEPIDIPHPQDLHEPE